MNPAPLTITANNDSMVQEHGRPTAVGKLQGDLVNGDSLASLATRPTVTTPATPASSPGTYPVFVGGASSPNYGINDANGILVVTPAP